LEGAEIGGAVGGGLGGLGGGWRGLKEGAIAFVLLFLRRLTSEFSRLAIKLVGQPLSLSLFVSAKQAKKKKKEKNCLHIFSFICYRDVASK